MYSPGTPSGQLSASANITTKPSYLYSVEVDSPTTGISTLVIYDSENSTLTGKTIIASIEQYAGETNKPILFPMPVIANRGIYCLFYGTLPTTYSVIYSLA